MSLTSVGQKWCDRCRAYKWHERRPISEELPHFIERAAFCRECGNERMYSREKVSFFRNPVQIAFDPASCDDKPEEGILLADVWRDPLARTLWLAVGSCHLKSQYFRRQCIENAKAFRACPPLTIHNFRMGLRADCGLMFGSYDYDFCRALYPFVIRCMFDNGEWPYIVPRNIAPEPLIWAIKTKERAA